MTDFETACTELHLPWLRKNFKRMEEEAASEGKSYHRFLEDVLKEEVENRENTRVQRRIKEAHFPFQMDLNRFEQDHLDEGIRKVISILTSMHFIDDRENVLLYGNPGVGKTALSIALGMEACLQNRKVLFVRVSDLLIELREAMSREMIRKLKRKFNRFDLIILDEFGFVSFDQKAGEVLFNLLAERNDNGSIIVTSNLLPEQWKDVFEDKMISAAIADRLTHRCYSLDMSGDSYRNLETRKWLSHKLKPDVN